MLVPLIAKHFTEAEFDAVIDSIISEIHPLSLFRELATFHSWWSLWCTPRLGCPSDKLEIFRKKVPMPVLFLSDSIFQPRYEDALHHLKSIETGVPYSPPLVHMSEIKAGAVGLIIVLAVWKILSFIVRRTCCRASAQKKTKKA